MHAVELSPAYSLVGDAPEPGEDKLRVFLKLTVETYLFDAFDAGARPQKRGACYPFHPAATVRNHVDAIGLDQVLWRVRVGAGRLRLRTAPHPSCIGQDERALVAFLGRLRSLAEIDAAELSPPPRTARLLAFLDAMGVIEVEAAPDASPYAVLELPEGAPLDQVKHAFRRLARELHPDLHPGLSAEALKELERRFADVSAAYSKLV